MRIAGSGMKRGISSIGKPAKSGSKRVVQDEDDSDVEIIPPPPPKLKKQREKLERLKTKAKSIGATVPYKTKSTQFDFEEADKSEVPVSRSLTVSTQRQLGIRSFEAEETLPETDGEGNYQAENVRENTRKIAEPTILADSKDDRVRAVKTLFGQRADDILIALESDATTDGALTTVQKTLLQTMVDVLPAIERGVRLSRGRKGVIPMNQTISQIRELVSDIQAQRDRGMLGASIVERVLRPSFLDIGVQLALAFQNIKLDAQSRIPTEQLPAFQDNLNTIQRSVASYMTAQYEEVKRAVTASLS